MAPNRLRIVALSLIFLCGGCESPSPSSSSEATATAPAPADHTPYVSVRLDADLSTFSAAQKEMVPLLIEAAQTMDVIFWEQTYGNRDSLLQSLSDTTKRRYVVNNYGPWDRLRGNHAFVEGEAPRPPGANFYPTDVTPDSLFAAELPLDTLQAPHTMVRRLPDGTLTALPYHLFFAESMSAAAAYLTDAADLTENAALAQFLRQRAEALTTGPHYRHNVKSD